MIFVFYIFAAVLVLLSYRSFRGGIEYLRFFKTELAKPKSDFTPFASIIAPCRGLDAGLAVNLEGLFAQDYPDYELIFVVDDESDAAVDVISELINHGDTETEREENKSISSVPLCLRGENTVSAKLVVAKKAVDSSQKVENLREAVLHVSDRSQIFVFADSDVRPARDWLRNLAAPLQNQMTGASTGYRWFICEHPGFGSEMRSVCNASIASALGANTNTNFCWGGSMAIRRDTFERLEMRDKWLGTLSDDFAVTNTLKAAKLHICFVPSALTASIEDCSIFETFEFTTRQMKITRTYAPNLWLLSFFGSGLFNAVMIAAILIIILSRQNDWAVAASIVTIALVSLFSIGKAWLRLEAVRLVLTDHAIRLRHQSWTQNTLWLLSPALFFCNSVAALFSRRMVWRGTTYELKSPNETVIITN